MNKVEITGKLHNDPKLLTTNKNVSLLKLFVKIETKYPGRDFVKLSYVPVVAWGTLANTHRSLKEGDEINIKGELEFQTWETKEGDKKSQLLVKATEISKVVKEKDTIKVDNNYKVDDLPF